jgi:Major Facilitator Superfamily
LTTVREEQPTRPGAVLLYFTPLTLLVFLVLPNGFLLDIATTFMLKNRLQASPEQVAHFRLVTAVPVYFSFAFGLARDLWNPFGRRDRGFLMLFGVLTACLFAAMTAVPVSYDTLLVGMLLVMASFSFVAAAARGLLALVSQEQLMSGRLSALWNALSCVPYSLGAFGAGYLAENLSPEETFLLVAFFSVLIAVVGLWKPPAVFSHAYDAPLARGSSFTGDVRRLVRHWPCYPAVLLVCLCQFSPGTNTPLQFYLTNELKLADSVYADFQGILITAYIPACIVYGFLCQRLSLRTLLWIATLGWLPMALPLLLIHSAASALWCALPIGFFSGFAFATFWDLTMRSCPPGLQGTLMMLVAGGYELAYRGGDLIGASIYASSGTGGFLGCVILGTATSALMIPVLLTVPRTLTGTADGQRDPARDREVLREIAAG